MDAKNRMVDVDILSCEACQDFMRLVLLDGWKQLLFDDACKAKKNKLELSRKVQSENTQNL